MTTNMRTLAQPKPRRLGIPEAIDIAVLSSFIGSVVFLIFQIAQGNAGIAGTATTPGRNYILMLLQCTAGIVAIHIPLLLNKFLRLLLPTALRVMFSGFLFCAISLGEVANFYYLVPHWDDILHFGSGMMLCLLGFMLANVMNRNRKLSPAFVAVFGLCFALAIGGLWEVYEFTFDGLLGLNMQKTMLASGEALAGHMAIADTMKDIVVDTVGAAVGTILGYKALKSGKAWISGSIREKEETLVHFGSNNEPKAA